VRAKTSNNKTKNPIEKSPPLKGESERSELGDDRNFYYNKSLKKLARQLRKQSTEAEIRLWSEFLRDKNTGYTFLRQRPVLNYIADFMCKELKLIIELDGFTHNFEQQWKKDLKRQKELKDKGFKILRFADEEVMNDLRNVEIEIYYWIKKLSDKQFKE